MARVTDFGLACDWVRDNEDKIDDLLYMETFPFPWTYRYHPPLTTFTPLDMAVIAKRRDIVEKMIARGAQTDNLEYMMEGMGWEPDDVQAVLDLFTNKSPGFFRLSNAVRRRDAGELEALLDRGGDPNRRITHSRNGDGTAIEPETVTLLEVAVSDGDVECVSLLLKRGAVIRPEAMMRVSQRRNDVYAIARLLLSAGARLPEPSPDAHGQSVLWKVCGRLRTIPENERHPLLSLLIKHGSDINVIANDGTTPLGIVCSHLHDYPADERLEVVALLVEQGADVTVGTPRPYIYSGFWYAPVAALLIRHGADVNAATENEGTTALMFAAARGEMKLISLLLGAGADPTVRDSEGRSAIDFARMRGKTKAVEMLLLAAGNLEQT